MSKYLELKDALEQIRREMEGGQANTPKRVTAIKALNDAANKQPAIGQVTNKVG